MTSIYKSPAGKQTIINFYEQLLHNSRQPLEQKIIPTTFGDTFVISSGQKTAPALILLHGSGSNSAMWLADIREYSKKFSVYCIDIIGECGKSSENRPDWTDSHYSDWLQEIYATLKIQKAVIVGCSLGGWIATDFTIKHKDKVNKLVLLATAGITQIRIKTIFWIIFTSFLGTWGFKKLNKIVYGGLELDEQAMQFAGLLKQHYIPRTDVLPIFQDEQLEQIQVPILFIGGEQDCFYNSHKTAARLSENIEQATIHVLPDTGHVLLDQTKKIISFVEGSA